MIQHKLSSAIVCLLVSTYAFAAGDKGEWTLSQSDNPGKIRLFLHSESDGNHSFSSSSDWNAGELKGLDWKTAGKHDVRFSIVRDAGTIDGEGFLKDGSGAGLFTFQGNAKYSQDMAALGFPGVTDDELFAYTIHDVSLAFVRGIKASGVTDVDKDKLIAFRIHGVSPEFVQQIHAAGVNESEAEKLIAFRIHGVSPEFVRDIHAGRHQRRGFGEADCLSDSRRLVGICARYSRRWQSIRWIRRS